MKYGESSFDILYLLFAIAAGCVMLRRAVYPAVLPARSSFGGRHRRRTDPRNDDAAEDGAPHPDGRCFPGRNSGRKTEVKDGGSAA